MGSLILSSKKKKKGGGTDTYYYYLTEGNDLSTCCPSTPSAIPKSSIYIKLECFRETDKAFCFLLSKEKKFNPQGFPLYLGSSGLMFTQWL